MHPILTLAVIASASSSGLMLTVRVFSGIVRVIILSPSLSRMNALESTDLAHPPEEVGSLGVGVGEAQDTVEHGLTKQR